MSDEIKFFIKGAGGSQPEQPKARIPVEAREGISGQFIESGNLSVPVDRVVSLTQIRTLDLISEGELEGLVSGEYSYVGYPGEIGYRSAVFKPFQSKVIGGKSIPYLRSIYWNETPVVDKDNLFNFQQIDVTYSAGTPNGSSSVGIGDELTISRNIQERLRGPNSILDAKNKQQAIGEAEQFAKYYRILNKDCKGAIVNVRVNALSQTIVGGTKAGDTAASSIFYRIYYKPIFNKAGTISAENVGPEDQAGYIEGKEEIIRGKISYGYIRSTRITFDEAYFQDPTFIGWAIKVFRLTPDSLQGTLRNQTYIDSITEIYGNSFCYPNSAIVSQKFSAEYFNQIPARAFDVRLLKVKIPSNYDPITKTYEGIWDGTWKSDEYGNDGLFWTDNPAWCFYDILTNSRYGLGKYISSSLVDKWTLYQISQYCDTMVPDGVGGVEPRFTCNMIITSREEAYRVLSDMASIFRAILYYQGGSIYTSMDIEKDSIYQFSNSNVAEGNFNYSSSSKRVRHSVAIVRYNDKTNFYLPAIEYVEDTEAIKKYGYRELEVAAFGCTSRGQAIRFGRWALLSESLETETVSFDAGLESCYLKPGDIFRVSDYYKTNSRRGGRIYDAYKSGQSSVVLLDDIVTGFKDSSTYKLAITSPSYSFDPTLVEGITSDDISNIRKNQVQLITFSGGDVSSISGYSRVIINEDNWSNQIDFKNRYVVPRSVWTIEATGNDLYDNNFNNQWDYYRVIKIEEKEENLFGINALQYDLSKYQAVDSGLNFENQVVQIGNVSAPDSLFLEYVDLEGSSNLKAIKYSISKTNMDGVNGFLVYAKLGDWESEDFSERFTNGNIPQVIPQTPNSEFLINVASNSNPSGNFIPLENGTYYFRVYSRNLQGIPSENGVSSSISVFDLNKFQGLRISSLRVEGNSDALLSQKAEDTISFISPTFRWQASLENAPSTPYTLGDVYYRMTIRKSTSPNSSAPATSDESPIVGDPYQPSSVIYHEEKGYKPDDVNNPSLSFDLIENISAFTKYYTNQPQGLTPSGAIRDYDVVVEAHLQDGSSSAGGNIFSTVRGGNLDSEYSQSKTNGWDILHVNNPKIPAIQLTEQADLDSCQIAAVSDPTRICTEQWINSNGTVSIDIKTNNLLDDIAGGFIYSCREIFSTEEALNGKKANGTSIYRGEFSDLSNPLNAASNLKDIKNGYVAVSFYDNLDKAFRDEMLKVNPKYNDVFISGLNVSNAAGAKLKSISSTLGSYVAWGQVFFKGKRKTGSTTKWVIEELSWFGPGIISVIDDGSTQNYAKIRIGLDSELVDQNANTAFNISYTYSNTPVGTNTVPVFKTNKNLPLLSAGTSPHNRFTIADNNLPIEYISKWTNPSSVEDIHHYNLENVVTILELTNEYAIAKIDIPQLTATSSIYNATTEAKIFIGIMQSSEGKTLSADIGKEF